jgi:hypothetical protein
VGKRTIAILKGENMPDNKPSKQKFIDEGLEFQELILLRKKPGVFPRHTLGFWNGGDYLHEYPMLYPLELITDYAHFQRIEPKVKVKIF